MGDVITVSVRRTGHEIEETPAGLLVTLLQIEYQQVRLLHAVSNLRRLPLMDRRPEFLRDRCWSAPPHWRWYASFKIAFPILSRCASGLNGYRAIPCHLPFCMSCSSLSNLHLYYGPPLHFCQEMAGIHNLSGLLAGQKIALERSWILQRTLCCAAAFPAARLPSSAVQARKRTATGQVTPVDFW